MTYINKLFCDEKLFANLSKGNLCDENAAQYSFLITLYAIALLSEKIDNSVLLLPHARIQKTFPGAVRGIILFSNVGEGF